MNLQEVLMMREFLAAIEALKKNKSPGPDEISNELLVHMSDKAKRTLYHIFVAMWTTGHTPQSLKHADVILLYKKGDKGQTKNYRPITLMNSILLPFVVSLHQSCSIFHLILRGH